MFTITNRVSAIKLHLLLSLFTHVTNGDVRKRIVIHRIFGIREKMRIFRRRCIVGTLTNKANVSPNALFAGGYKCFYVFR